MLHSETCENRFCRPSYLHTFSGVVAPSIKDDNCFLAFESLTSSAQQPQLVLAPFKATGPSHHCTANRPGKPKFNG